MVWNNRDVRFNFRNANSRDAFKEHNERMKEFRRSHTDVSIFKAPGYHEPGLLESPQPLKVSYTMIETGGSGFLSGQTGWLALIPVFKVARYKLSHN